MSSKTTNYNMHKIDLADSPPDITVLNQNFDKIDEEMHKQKTDFTTHLDKTSQVATFGASVNQSIASGVDTSIVFSTTKGYNNSNLALIDNGKIKVLKKGVYHLEASIGIMYEEARVGFRSLAVEGNVAKQVPMPSTPNNLNVYKTIFIGSDNYTLSIEAFQNSGLALDALSYATKVTLRKVADLL